MIWSSLPGIGILSQNFVPSRLKALVWAMAKAILTPSTKTLIKENNEDNWKIYKKLHKEGIFSDGNAWFEIKEQAV